ncbi:hypothetical protein AAG747_09210 [Rapidithrix thailandica]|uniref:Uncharacterized protein n=1 Tax=Rapidithrix thailandica TaxID=413964 RepID=A0AAW9S9S2_9BACT
MKPRIIRGTSFLVIVILHMVFIASILFEKINTTPILVIMCMISVFVTLAYVKVPLRHDTHFMDDFSVVLLVALGAAISYYFNIQLGLGPVLSVGLIGTVASFVPKINKKSERLQLVPGSIYCGSFIGMTKPSIATDWHFVLLAGTLAGILLVFSKGVFHGMGGKLGTIAFGGVALASLFLFLFF